MLLVRLATTRMHAVAVQLGLGGFLAVVAAMLRACGNGTLATRMRALLWRRDGRLGHDVPRFLDSSCPTSHVRTSFSGPPHDRGSGPRAAGANAREHAGVSVPAGNQRRVLLAGCPAPSQRRCSPQPAWGRRHRQIAGRDLATCACPGERGIAYLDAGDRGRGRARNLERAGALGQEISHRQREALAVGHRPSGGAHDGHLIEAVATAERDAQSRDAERARAPARPPQVIAEHLA